MQNSKEEELIRDLQAKNEHHFVLESKAVALSAVLSELDKCGNQAKDLNDKKNKIAEEGYASKTVGCRVVVVRTCLRSSIEIFPSSGNSIIIVLSLFHGRGSRSSGGTCQNAMIMSCCLRVGMKSCGLYEDWEGLGKKVRGIKREHGDLLQCSNLREKLKRRS
jgi:hypothetical protein